MKGSASAKLEGIVLITIHKPPCVGFLGAVLLIEVQGYGQACNVQIGPRTFPLWHGSDSSGAVSRTGPQAESGYTMVMKLRV